MSAAEQSVAPVTVTQEDREAERIARVEQFAMGPHTTPEECSDILAVTQLARHRLATCSAAVPDAEEVPVILAALQAYRSLPAGTVREFPMLEARANDPNDNAHKVLTARLPGLREKYNQASAKVELIDGALAALTDRSATEAGLRQKALEEAARLLENHSGEVEITYTIPEHEDLTSTGRPYRVPATSAKRMKLASKADYAAAIRALAQPVPSVRGGEPLFDAPTGEEDAARSWLQRFKDDLATFDGDKSGIALAWLGNQAELGAAHVEALLSRQAK